MKAALIYPHQLFEDHPALRGVKRVVLVEEPLHFRQYDFHRQKLILHRVSMRRFAERLEERGYVVKLVGSYSLRKTGDIADALMSDEICSVQYVDPCDDWLGNRLAESLNARGIEATILEHPHFLTPTDLIEAFEEVSERLFFARFYQLQRKRLGIMIDDDGLPIGGKWSFDTENRKKLPKYASAPYVLKVKEDGLIRNARNELVQEFPKAIGSEKSFGYPTDHREARLWLEQFLDERLHSFGPYEDAISRDHEVLFHSVLTPVLNIGLLSPREVVDSALACSRDIPLNSLEGFIRQVIGWREYMRLVYLTRGRKQRTSNFWGFRRKMPRSFYDGSTGIVPVDNVIQKVLRTGYCHHIERLMILGNFMMLCEIHPNEVYRWFMEMFIDAYDWVMVPNVYGMSQFADGGTIVTKPYLSSSNYISKMSDYPRGPWSEIWDGLYWRFVSRNLEFFRGHPRLSQTAHLAGRLGSKLYEHIAVAEKFLDALN